MVATISKLHGGNATYYTKSYYLNGRADSEWLDTDAGFHLKLAGEPVRPKAFERLLRGFHPEEDEKLVQNAGDENRQLGWDLQFGVDKSFSVLYALVPEARAEMEASIKDAMRRAVIDVFEAEFLESRRGEGGKLREPVSSPVAMFLHRTNRENEIHLHCHAAIPNVGIREDGTSGTIVSWNLYDAKLALGKALHARYVEQVTARLGIECEFDEKGLSRVRGFPEHVAEALSTPSRKIAEIAEDESARAKEEANLKIRSKKADVPLEAVIKGCHERAETLGFTPDDARGFLGRVSRAEQASTAEAALDLLRAVLDAMPEEFSKARLFEQAFREGARAGLPFAAVNEAIRETLSDGAALQHLGRVGGQEQYRKARGFDEEVSPHAGEETHEEELRGLLGQIIQATPELNVAEFLPLNELRSTKTLDQGRDAALSSLENAFVNHARAREALANLDRAELREGFERISAAAPGLSVPEIRLADLEKSVSVAMAEVMGDSGLLKDALQDNEGAKAALTEAVKREFNPGIAAEEQNSFGTISVDTTSPALDAQARAGRESERLEDRFVDEATRGESLPEEKARSLFRDAIDVARKKYAERLIDSAVTKGLQVLTEKEAHFTREELGGAVNRELAGSRIPHSHRAEVIDRALNDPRRVTLLGDYKEATRYTTPEMLRVEQDAIRAAEALQERSGHAREGFQVRRRLEQMPAFERNAVAKALSGSDFVLIEGRNGPEMQAVQRGIREALGPSLVQRGIENVFQRKDLLWVVPTATAARELERSVGAEHVASLQKLLHSLDQGVSDVLKHHGTMVIRAAAGMHTWDAQPLKLTPNSTVILDSASLADSRQLSRLLKHTEKAGARLIACGTHDLPSLGPGGLFKELRQRSDEAHVVTLAQGVTQPVEIRRGGREQAKKALIEQWAKEALKKPQEHTIVSASTRDVHDLNTRAQGERKRAGLLGFRSIQVRYKHDGKLIKERIYEGDRVVFTARTAKETINGVFGTVKHIDLITGRIKVKLDLKEKRYLPWEFERNKTIEFQYRKYFLFQRREEGFRLGYAATVYRTQNVAVEGNSYCLLDGPDGAPSAVYAGLGLAKGNSYFFGDDAGGRAELLQEKETAHAVVRQVASEERLIRVAQAQHESGREEAEQNVGQNFGMSL